MSPVLLVRSYENEPGDFRIGSVLGPWELQIRVSDNAGEIPRILMGLRAEDRVAVD
jgi:hypothetical protein